jgi:type IV secretion system protein VirB6
MGSLYYSTLVDALLHELDELLNNYIYHGYSALVSYLEMPLAILITLYIILLGYSIVGGWVSMSMSVFIKSITKIGLIYLFAMNWGWFSEYVVELFFTATGQVADVIISATPMPLPTFSGEGIDGAMQSVLLELWDIGQWIWDTGSLNHITSYIGALGIWISGAILIGLALFEIIMAKCMLSILLVVAPIFIIFTLFDSTQDFFNRWLGSCSGYAFLIILISATISLSMSVAQWSIGDAYITKAVGLKMLQILPIIFVSFICIGLLRRSAFLALGIGSSVAMFSRNRAIGAGVASFVLNTLAPVGIGVAQLLKRANTSSAESKRASTAEKTHEIKKSLQRGDHE